MEDLTAPFLLEPVWRSDGAWVALRAHCPASQLQDLAAMLAQQDLTAWPVYWQPEPGAADGIAPDALPKGIHALLPPDALLVNGARRLSATHTPPAPALVSGVVQTGIAQGLPQDVWCTGPWPRTGQATQTASRNPAQPVLLQLLSLIVSDADTEELEAVFARSPQLVLRLLRLVNSVAVSGTRKAQSLHQAIAVLGRRQLRRWLQLLLYAEQYVPDGGVPPLLLLVALRARRLESWAAAGWLGGVSADAAFLAGMLSCLDVLFGEPLPALLGDLPLDPLLMRALLEGAGELGAALARMPQLEAADLTALAQWSAAHSVEWRHTEVATLAWVSQLARSMA
ncbi:HDOD domain-containing protein [Amantichitinum ursilacus]|uniref:HDOD domain protein n=1 Tax=Amantichitinum ursilacus TaxID=857265 RepID=A0A0N1JRH1_9NEIS|nr:HDOD domain-containing protein [Amantichitinum ursilacus]KPC49332.1 HDOD domain protein [Amantichitinum ursilacus]